MATDTITRAECRIFVTCLASYNNGRLYGRWIDVDGKDGDELRAEVSAMLAASPEPGAEEWAIHDFEGFGGIRLSESESMEDVATLAEGLSCGDRFGFLWLVGDRGMSPSEAVDEAANVSVYQCDAWDIASDYAQELFDQMHPLTDSDALNRWPFTCIDWGQAGKELLIGGDVALGEADGERFLVTNANDF